MENATDEDMLVSADLDDTFEDPSAATASQSKSRSPSNKKLPRSLHAQVLLHLYQTDGQMPTRQQITDWARIHKVKEDQVTTLVANKSTRHYKPRNLAKNYELLSKFCFPQDDNEVQLRKILMEEIKSLEPSYNSSQVVVEQDS